MVERVRPGVSWFTSFGYQDGAGNRRVLEEIHRSLRPGGRVLLDLNHGPSWWGRLVPSSTVKRGDDLMIDQVTYDPMNGRSHNHRTIVRDGRVRTVDFETGCSAWGFSGSKALGVTGLLCLLRRGA